MKYVIIDTRAGNAEILCGSYGDYETFETYESAECFRSMYCDCRQSYVFPRKSARYGGLRNVFGRIIPSGLFRK